MVFEEIHLLFYEKSKQELSDFDDFDVFYVQIVLCSLTKQAKVIYSSIFVFFYDYHHFLTEIFLVIKNAMNANFLLLLPMECIFICKM